MEYSGSCHCQKVKYSVEMTLDKVISCNCSMCLRKGSLLAFVPESAFNLQSGADSMTDYQFNKKKIHHNFCATCGVTAFARGEMPNGDKMIAINVRCLDGVELEKLNIQKIDGRGF